MKLLGVKMNVKNIIIIVLVLLGSLSLLKMCGLKVPLLEHASCGSHDDKKKNLY
jgi:hypothetical protein|tara:strand:- start:299 stop:460 length:162 start_codon:yes stop_codon:yes gene_type:complete